MHRVRTTVAVALILTVTAALAPPASTAGPTAQERAASSADAGSPSDAALLQALRAGGLVLVMRHASSPREIPTPQSAKPDNTKLERQLDDAGVRGATAVGEALRALRIPIGRVLTSPAYRTVETARFAKLADAAVAEELSDNGRSMAGVTEAQAEWLRSQASRTPSGGNTLLVTHQPNFARAFTAWGEMVAEGEIAVLRPDGRGGSTLIGRIRVEDWSRLRAVP